MKRYGYLTAALLVFLFAVSAVAASLGNQKQLYAARDRVLPALVHIQPVIQNFRTGELEKQAVIGSGVIFHPDGYVVTNYHVAGKAVRIFCTLSDREVVPATFIGGDPATDLAVIKLDLTDYKGTFSVAKFGDSDSLEVGEFVLAMGSPLALSRSVSAGVVSTKDRSFESDVRLPSGEPTGIYNLWIQTDAAINPGNSGGPLVNMDGEVVGINSRATLFANNIGFAIPINIVKEVTAAILDHGEVIRSYIGVQGQALQELEKYFMTDRNRGVLIASIDNGSPAQDAGLQAGDIILSVDDIPVSARFTEELPAFYRMIANYPPGSMLSLAVQRDSSEFNATVTTRKLGALLGDDFEVKSWGFTIKGITEQMRIDEQLKDTLGVFVAGVKRTGEADDAGLRRGDVIKKIDSIAVNGLTDFTKHYEELSGADKKPILLITDRRGATRYVLIKQKADSMSDENGGEE